MRPCEEIGAQSARPGMAIGKQCSDDRDLCERVFVRGRTVDGWYSRAVHAEVNRELAAVVDDVVDDEAAEGSDLRDVEQVLASALEGPISHQLLVGGFCERRARGCHVLVEELEDLLPRRHYVGLSRRRTRRGDVERIGVERGTAEARKFGDMAGEAAELHGFV